jgi:hypothetical protein
MQYFSELVTEMQRGHTGSFRAISRVEVAAGLVWDRTRMVAKLDALYMMD